eukprot:gene12062-5556_t
MKEEIKTLVLKETQAQDFIVKEKIQDLWSGYGEILRITLTNSKQNESSAILKYVTLPNIKNHPKGWNTNISHQRKIKSYQVEIAFYQELALKCTEQCYVPKLLGSYQKNDEYLMILQDLNSSGFTKVIDKPTVNEMKICIKWLANFHATFMNELPTNLWNIGTYWHLETRPDEFQLLDKKMKKISILIDEKLNSSKFQTIIHGDAKIHNFCFSPDSIEVAAVDFQYVGGGCGMKDFVYFLSSCFDSFDYEKSKETLLCVYFDTLKDAMREKNSKINFNDLENVYRNLLDYCWIDFYRFLKGWSPNFWKIKYIEELVSDLIQKINI